MAGKARTLRIEVAAAIERRHLERRKL